MESKRRPKNVGFAGNVVYLIYKYIIHSTQLSVIYFDTFVPVPYHTRVPILMHSNGLPMRESEVLHFSLLQLDTG